MPHKATTKIRQQKTRETNNKHAISEKNKKKRTKPGNHDDQSCKKTNGKNLKVTSQLVLERLMFFSSLFGRHIVRKKNDGSLTFFYIYNLIRFN